MSRSYLLISIQSNLQEKKIGWLINQCGSSDLSCMDGQDIWLMLFLDPLKVGMCY